MGVSLRPGTVFHWMLLSIAEDVALPCMNNMIARCFPRTERSRAVALAMAGFQLGSAIGLTLSNSHVPGWFVWTICYIWSIRLSLGSELGIFVMLSWMPIYFKTIYRVDLRQAAWFSAVPWSIMALMGYAAGVLSDRMIRIGMSVTPTRKVMQSFGFFGPGVALIGLTKAPAPTPTIASAWLTLAVGLKAFSHSGFLVNFQEIVPQYSGVLHATIGRRVTIAADDGGGHRSER
ncbi:unnamed protein product [Cuscuta campestris]|uniref:Major facilitator superfamily (MFS) profile domain-containing protein n=1 Tax=Cuscuta campestris TaxID=132261 RepID=A0A484MUH4_9ASTE|nr:unnamed protein product [Cuscuta campestris]